MQPAANTAHQSGAVEQALLKHVEPHHIVFDVGANVGTFTRMLATIAREVHAFEPNPEVAAKLSAVNFPANVHLHELAMSNSIGEQTFYIDTRPEYGSVASSLMVLTDLKSAGLTRPVTVKTTTIDAFVAATGIVPGFIKIDVEGYEPQVLSGAAGTIDRHRPIIVFEMWETHWPRYADTFARLDKSYRLVKSSDGTDALNFYLNNRAAGVEDILALPR